MVTFCLCGPLDTGCKSKGGLFCLRPSHKALGIYPHGRDDVRCHPFFFFSNFCLVFFCHRTGKRRVRHCREGTSHIRHRVSTETLWLIFGFAKICSALMSLLSWQKGSYHGTTRFFHSKIPSVFSHPSTFPVLWCFCRLGWQSVFFSESVFQNKFQNLDCRFSEWEWHLKLRTKFLESKSQTRFRSAITRSVPNKYAPTMWFKRHKK